MLGSLMVGLIWNWVLSRGGEGRTYFCAIILVLGVMYLQLRRTQQVMVSDTRQAAAVWRYGEARGWGWVSDAPGVLVLVQACLSGSTIDRWQQYRSGSEILIPGVFRGKE